MAQQAAVQKREFAMLTYGVLARSRNNVRSTSAATNRGGMSIPELAASIYANGILQNLVVTPQMKKGKHTGKYEVEAGGRRHSALDLLFSQKRIGKDYPVPVLIEDKAVATQVSLTENIHREAMHPAGEFAAFHRLVVEEGKSVGDVAAAFGYSEQTVKRGLKLASVSPRLFQLYREGGIITVEQLIALAISDDHAAQECVWDNAIYPWQRTPQKLREALTESEIFSKSSLALFVGVDAYVAAGGAVRRDLFGEEGDCYLLDSELLTRLAMEKLEAAAASYRGSRWLWLEVQPALNSAHLHNHRRLSPSARAPSKAEQKKLDAIAKKIQALYDQQEGLDEEASDDEYDALNEQIAAAEAEQGALEETLKEWSPESRRCRA